MYSPFATPFPFGYIFNLQISPFVVNSVEYRISLEVVEDSNFLYSLIVKIVDSYGGEISDLYISLGILLEIDWNI